MATNLRLRPETENALRAESERTGRSQQDLIRIALDEYLGLAKAPVDLIASGVAKPPRPLRAVTTHLRLTGGLSSLDLLDRDDRI